MPSVFQEKDVTQTQVLAPSPPTELPDKTVSLEQSAVQDVPHSLSNIHRVTVTSFA